MMSDVALSATGVGGADALGFGKGWLIQWKWLYVCTVMSMYEMVMMSFSTNPTLLSSRRYRSFGSFG